MVLTASLADIVYLPSVTVETPAELEVVYRLVLSELYNFWGAYQSMGFFILDALFALNLL